MAETLAVAIRGGGLEQLTETDLTVLSQACDLLVRAFRDGAERAEHAVEKLNFTARAERALSTQRKIDAALAEAAMPGEAVYRQELVIMLETDQPFEENALEVVSRLFGDLEKETVRLLTEAMPRMGHHGQVRLEFEHRSGDEWEATV